MIHTRTHVSRNKRNVSTRVPSKCIHVAAVESIVLSLLNTNTCTRCCTNTFFLWLMGKKALQFFLIKNNTVFSLGEIFFPAISLGDCLARKPCFIRTGRGKKTGTGFQNFSKWTDSMEPYVSTVFVVNYCVPFLRNSFIRLTKQIHSNGACSGLLNTFNFSYNSFLWYVCYFWFSFISYYVRWIIRSLSGDGFWNVENWMRFSYVKVIDVAFDLYPRFRGENAVGYVDWPTVMSPMCTSTAPVRVDNGYCIVESTSHGVRSTRSMRNLYPRHYWIILLELFSSNENLRFFLFRVKIYIVSQRCQM